MLEFAFADSKGDSNTDVSLVVAGAIAKLHSANLVSQPQQSFLDTHRLIQDFCRSEHDASTRALKHVIAGLLRTSDGYDRDRHETWNAVDLVKPHARATAERKESESEAMGDSGGAVLFARIADHALRSQFAADEARTLCDQALSYTPNSAAALLTMSRIDEAASHFQAALARIIEAAEACGNGDDAGDTLLLAHIKIARSGVLTSLGRYDDALKDANEATDQLKFDADIKAGAALRGVGRYDESLARIRDALAATDENTLRRAEATEEEATTLKVKGKYDDAMAAAEMTLQTKRAVLKDDNHPAIATVKLLMGEICERQGKYAESLQELDEAMEMLGKSGVEDGSVAASVLSWKGWTLKMMRRYNEARPVLDKALAIGETIFGRNSPSVGTTLNHIGVLLMDQGKHDEALVNYEEALRITKAALGDNHPNVGAIVGNIAIIFKKQGKYGEALVKYEECMRIFIAAYGNDHPHVARTQRNMGNLQCERINFAEARRLYQASYDMNMRLLGPDHPDTKESKRGIARIRNK